MRIRHDADLVTVKAQVCARLGLPDEMSRRVIGRELLSDPGTYYVEVNHDDGTQTTYRFTPDEDGPIDIGPREDWNVVTS
jgi:arylamine N-acetyltransferase